MTLRDLHRTSAVVIAAFAAVHIINHLVSLSGVSNHIAFMDTARTVYRQPVLEALLLFCVAFQVSSGMWFVIRDWKQRSGGVASVQAASGAYLALFLLLHISAVLIGRSALGLDTNFYYAAAGFHVQPFQLFFAPYYFLAVVALFTHLGCAAYWRVRSPRRVVRIVTLMLPIGLGTAASLLIGLSLAGHIAPVDVPTKYKATYARTAANPSVQPTCTTSTAVACAPAPKIDGSSRDAFERSHAAVLTSLSSQDRMRLSLAELIVLSPTGCLTIKPLAGQAPLNQTLSRQAELSSCRKELHGLTFKDIMNLAYPQGEPASGGASGSAQQIIQSEPISWFDSIRSH